MAETAAVADGLATALFFGSRLAQAGLPLRLVRMFASGRAESSPDFEGELFT